MFARPVRPQGAGDPRHARSPCSRASRSMFGIVPNRGVRARNGTLVMQTGLAAGACAHLGAHESGVDRPERRDDPGGFRRGPSSSLLSNKQHRMGALARTGGGSPSGSTPAPATTSGSRQLPAGPLSRLTFDSTVRGAPPVGARRTGSSPTSWTATVRSAQRRADGTGSGGRRSSRTKEHLLEGFWSRDGTVAGGADRRRQTGGVGQREHRRAQARGGQRRRRSCSPPRARRVGARALSRTGGGWRTPRTRPAARRCTSGPSPTWTTGSGRSPPTAGRHRSGRHSGRELFYVDAARNMMVAPVPTGDPSSSARGSRLFTLGDDIYLNRRRSGTRRSTSLRTTGDS